MSKRVQKKEKTTTIKKCLNLSFLFSLCYVSYICISTLKINKDVYRINSILETVSNLNEAISVDKSKPAPPVKSYPFTIITASSANHLCSLENFLYSLHHLRDQLEPNEFPRIVVYNLGLNRTQLPILDQLQQHGLIDDLQMFDYFRYPAFWDIALNAGEYAWKTGILKETTERYPNQTLVWLDAGNRVSPDFIRKIPGWIKKQGGFWSPQSSQTMADWTHPGLFRYFDVSGEEYGKFRNCNGAALGFDVSNKAIVEELIEPWYRCGLEKDCIAPEGSSRKNHRQDQAAITFLVYRSGRKCMKSPGYYKLAIHQDKACRDELLALDQEGKLFHPSSIDQPKWYASHTLQLYHHPEWRYPEDKIPDRLKN